MAVTGECNVAVYSEHFLGTRDKCHSFLDVLMTIDGGIWMPDKWGHYEPIRRPFSIDETDAIVRAWTEERPPGSGRSVNTILFRKRGPRSLVQVSTARTQTPMLNWASFDFAAAPFASEDGPRRLEDIVLAMVGWSDGVYATASHSRQLHQRGVGGTPLARLAGLNWLTYFGTPYVEMFGRTHLLRTPCHRTQPIGEGVLLVAAPRPESPELTMSNELLLKLEEYLGADAFAGRGYPKVPCRVPQFDLSETVINRTSTAPANRPH